MIRAFAQASSPGFLQAAPVLFFLLFGASDVRGEQNLSTFLRAFGHLAPVGEVARAYDALVITNADIQPLPYPIAGERLQLFRPEEVKERAAHLPPREKEAVLDAVSRGIKEHARKQPLDRQTQQMLGLQQPGPTTLLFTNPDSLPDTKDLLLRAGLQDDLATRIRLEIFSLVQAGLYEESPGALNGASLPSLLSSAARDELDRQRDALLARPGAVKDGQRRTLRGLKIEVVALADPGDEEDRDTHLVAEVLGDTIFLTPAFVRAAFLVSMRENGEMLSRLFFHLNGNPTFLETLDEAWLGKKLQEEARQVRRCFQRSLTFLLAHEVAHVLGADTEEDADQLAVRHLRRLDGQITLGVFDSLLFRSLVDDGAVFFGLSPTQSRALESRLAELRAAHPTPEDSAPGESCASVDPGGNAGS